MLALFGVGTTASPRAQGPSRLVAAHPSRLARRLAAGVGERRMTKLNVLQRPAVRGAIVCGLVMGGLLALDVTPAHLVAYGQTAGPIPIFTAAPATKTTTTTATLPSKKPPVVKALPATGAGGMAN